MFDDWFSTKEYAAGRISILQEKDGGRDKIHDELVQVIADHLLGLEVIESMGGFDEAANFLKNRLPSSDTSRSGDFGEILASEYIDARTDYKVPIKRLRHKDDRNNAMRGDDVIGIKEDGGDVKVLKGEAKSRVNLTTKVVKEARDGLSNYQGRPNPGTLAFIQYELAVQEDFVTLKLVKRLQDEVSISIDRVVHLLFTVSGNDPTAFLRARPNARKIRGINLLLSGCHVKGHADLVSGLFESCHQLGDSDGKC